jgi:hypothetical protein
MQSPTKLSIEHALPKCAPSTYFCGLQTFFAPRRPFFGALRPFLRPADNSYFSVKKLICINIVYQKAFELAKFENAALKAHFFDVICYQPLHIFLGSEI